MSTTRIPHRIVASIMAFGSGLLISALSFDLVKEAHKRGGFVACALGFVGGALIFTAANWYLSNRGAAERKSFGNEQPSEGEEHGSGMAIALGADRRHSRSHRHRRQHDYEQNRQHGCRDRDPPVQPSGGAVERRRHEESRRSKLYVFGVSGGIAVLNGVAAALGNLLFIGFSQQVIAATMVFAAGAILAMLIDTMIPEAFQIAQHYAGMIAVVGFLAAIYLSKLSG